MLALYAILLSLSFAVHAVPSWPHHRPSSYGRGVQVATLGHIKHCIVYANGGISSDVSNILEAFEICGYGGKITFPEDQEYFIASKLNPHFKNLTIEWRGTWTMSPDINLWRQDHYPIAFQNHAASFVLTGDGLNIDGYGTGAIHGNGDVWYTAEAGVTQPGRPMPFVFWNVSDVTVSNFQVLQPPLWSLNIMNGTNMRFENITCNATSTQAPYGENWVQNTDGFDTMDVNNVYLNNLVYQGGDDCVAVKPRSYNVRIEDVTCHGGNGIAVGSLGQYLEDSSVENLVVDNVTVIRINEDLHNSAYIKTWIGVLTPQDSYESAGLPRGGGWGSVRNLLFSNFKVFGADSGPAITQDSGDNGTSPGTSLMEISNVAFVNFTGYLSGDEENGRIGSVSCSGVHPCYNIDFKDIMLNLSENTTDSGRYECQYIERGGVHGVTGSGC